MLIDIALIPVDVGVGWWDFSPSARVVRVAHLHLIARAGMLHSSTRRDAGEPLASLVRRGDVRRGCRFTEVVSL